MKKFIKKSKVKSNIVWFSSIQSRVVFLLVFCIVLALAVSYISIVPGSQRSLIQSSESNMNDLTISNVRLINKSLEAVSETMTGLKHSDDLYTYIILGGMPYKAQSEIDTYLQDNKSFSCITIYDKEGKAILSSSAALVGSDGTLLNYVQKALKTGEISQSGIIKDGINKASIICAVPLVSTSDDPIGVICVTVPVEYITNILNGAKLQNIKSSYAFLVDEQGRVLYHPNKELIGFSPNNKIINDVVKQLAKDQIPKAKAITYDENGTTKYISYSVSELNHWTLAIVANKDELLEPIQGLFKRSTVILVALLIVLILLSYFFASGFTKPIKELTKIITSIGELDFKADSVSERLCKRKDETGEMSRMIQKMRTNIRDIIEKINLSSERLNSNSDNLINICNNVNKRSDDNSATVQQLLAAMEETASVTDTINSNIINIEGGTKDINAKSLEGIKLSDEIVDRANSLQESTLKAVEKIKSIYNEVQDETSIALEQSKTVSKINVLTNTIIGIANQTRLLSLNASIEAARAGDVGKGFAVVASEIGSLSAQSAKTVTEITTIVGEVTTAVRNIDACLQKTLDLIENNILPDYQGYIAVSDQYNQDAQIFHKTMENVQNEISRLSSITEEIASSISEINVTINNSTNEVSDISMRTTDIVGLTVETYDKAKENSVSAQELKDIVNKFEL